MRAEPSFGTDAALDDVRPPDRDAPAFVDEPIEAPAAVRALEDGRAFTVIVEPDPDASARLVGDVARALSARGVPVTVVRNPTPWPMTLDKLIAQVGGEPGSDPEQLLREAMAGPFHDHTRAVLAIDQADTLDDRALTFLSDLSKALRASGSEFQLVFAGRDTLARKLRAHGFGASSSGGARRGGVIAIAVACVAAVALGWLLLAGDGTQVARQAPAAAPQATQPAAAPAAPADQASAPAAADQAAVVQAPAPAAAENQAPTPPAEASAPAVATTPAPASPEAEPAAASVEEREAALRRDFSAFLDQSGTQTARLTQAQRDALFKDYLVWRLRPGGSSPVPGAASP